MEAGQPLYPLPARLDALARKNRKNMMRTSLGIVSTFAALLLVATTTQAEEIVWLNTCNDNTCTYLKGISAGSKSKDFRLQCEGKFTEPYTSASCYPPYEKKHPEGGPYGCDPPKYVSGSNLYWDCTCYPSPVQAYEATLSLTGCEK